MTRTRKCVALMAMLVLAFAAGSCGGDDDDDTSAASDTTTASTGPPATASAELCQARDELKTSFEALTDINIVRDGTSALRPAIDEVTDNLRSMKEIAGDDFRTEINAFETSLSALQDALGDVSSNGVSSVVQAVADAGRSGSTLVDSLNSMQCA